MVKFHAKNNLSGIGVINLLTEAKETHTRLSELNLANFQHWPIANCIHSIDL